MIINFDEYNRKKVPTEEELLEAERLQLIENLESINIDDALRGAIMVATGQNTVLGVDYSLQKDRCLKAAYKYDETMKKLRNFLSQVEWNEDE